MLSSRLRQLPPFLFNQIDAKKRAAAAAGKDVINLGTGDPDRPTHAFIVDEMARAIRNPDTHRYPDCWGTQRFLQAAARFMQRRFGVVCDPNRNILATLGGKDGIAHLPLATLNPGDGSIVFVPAYPVYANATILASGVVHAVATSPETGWNPRIADARQAAAKSRLLWLNLPGNPTGAVGHPGTYAEALELAREHNLIVASDVAYSEVYFGTPPSSLWQTPGASVHTTRAIEFHSLSKSFNMTGWRIGFAVGHADVIDALRTFKDNVDSGVFNAIQDAGAVALDRFNAPELAAMREEYRVRRDIAVAGLRRIGCKVEAPSAGIFVWARCPAAKGTDHPQSSMDFCGRMIEELGVVTVPGAGFHPSADAWFRLSLTRETHRITEAMERLARV